MFERRLYYHIDWALVIAILALCALGVVMIDSTTSDPTRGTSHLYVTQLYAIVIGLGAAGVLLMIDYRTFTDKSHFIYIALIAALVYVMFFGTVQMGARRWIALGGFNLQPSEFAKIGVALVLAKYFGENRGAPGWPDLAIADSNNGLVILRSLGSTPPPPPTPTPEITAKPTAIPTPTPTPVPTPTPQPPSAPRNLTASPNLPAGVGLTWAEPTTQGTRPRRRAKGAIAAAPPVAWKKPKYSWRNEGRRCARAVASEL